MLQGRGYNSLEPAHNGTDKAATAVGRASWRGQQLVHIQELHEDFVCEEEPHLSSDGGAVHRTTSSHDAQTVLSTPAEELCVFPDDPESALDGGAEVAGAARLVCVRSDKVVTHALHRPDHLAQVQWAASQHHIFRAERQ